MPKGPLRVRGRVLRQPMNGLEQILHFGNALFAHWGAVRTANGFACADGAIRHGGYLTREQRDRAVAGAVVPMPAVRPQLRRVGKSQ